MWGIRLGMVVRLTTTSERFGLAAHARSRSCRLARESRHSSSVSWTSVLPSMKS